MAGANSKIRKWFADIRQKWDSRPRLKARTRPVLISAVATLFATIGATWVTERYQTEAWIRDKQFEIFQQNLTGGLALVDELAEHMSTRLLGLRRVVWVAKKEQHGELEEVWDEYYGSVIAWNTKLLRYKGQLRRFIGPDVAEEFCSRTDYQLSYIPGEPESMHGHFLVTHQKVKRLIDCVRESCNEDARKSALKAANEAINTLGTRVEDFVESSTGRIYQRAAAE